jgi:hypothetical protein
MRGWLVDRIHFDSFRLNQLLLPHDYVLTFYLRRFVKPSTDRFLLGVKLTLNVKGRRPDL